MIDDVTGYGIAQYNAVFAGTASEVVQAYEYTASGEGAATEAKQDTIIAAITPVLKVYTPQPSSQELTLVRGDAYDGAANAVLTWTASKDVTDETINFTIRGTNDQIIIDQDSTGVTTLAAGTAVTVSLTSAATSLLPLGETKFDVEVEFSATSRWTIAVGNCCIQEDQSR
jgi:hypothetical protein